MVNVNDRTISRLYTIKMDSIINCINKTATNDNIDMRAVSGGRLHNGDGFKIRVLHAENVSDELIYKWKRICYSYGYNTKIWHQNQTSNIICIKSKSSMTLHHLFFLCSFISSLLLVFRQLSY